MFVNISDEVTTNVIENLFFCTKTRQLLRSQLSKWRSQQLM
ncbi:hypothetical protein [Aphanothece sacrum]|nr:hypothetical protein [Aphanothece sacrum]